MSHVVVISREPNPSCNFCAVNQHYVRPAYTPWLRNHGVTQADFFALVDPLIERGNRSADRCVPYTLVSILSCGFLGWCCQLAEMSAGANAVRNAIEDFNRTHQRKGVQVAASSGVLLFSIV